ncbi:MAG TPA: PEGA domain-containing protein [Allosphingosinicella sp.]
MKRYFAICGLAAVSMLLPACATVTRGTSQKYAIESTPAQAEVALSTGQKCITPCKLKLKRKHGFTATFNKPGYETLRAQVKSKFSGGGAAAGAGNILVGGIIGAAVDGSSGAMNNLTPNPLKVTLVPLTDAQNVGEASTGPIDAPAPAETPEAAAQPNPEL